MSIDTLFGIISVLVACGAMFWAGYQRGRHVEAQEFLELANRATTTHEFITAIVARGERRK